MDLLEAPLVKTLPPSFFSSMPPVIPLNPLEMSNSPLVEMLPILGTDIALLAEADPGLGMLKSILRAFSPILRIFIICSARVEKRGLVNLNKNRKYLVV